MEWFKTPVVGGFFWNDRLLAACGLRSFHCSLLESDVAAHLFFEVWSIHVETSYGTVASNWSSNSKSGRCCYTFSLLSCHETRAFFYSYSGRVWKCYNVIESETRPLKALRSPGSPKKKNQFACVRRKLSINVSWSDRSEAKKASGLEFGCLDSYPTSIYFSSPVILGKLLNLCIPGFLLPLYP